MPELPEVETTLRGIAPHLEGRRLDAIVVRDGRLRWPVPEEVCSGLHGARLGTPWRRAKYLILPVDHLGALIIHLGMSGSLRIVSPEVPPRKHDHVDFRLSDGMILRFHDPRRFGSVLFSETPLAHPLLRDLGPEPFDVRFDASYLYERSRGRLTSIKAFIMDSHTVVGVGNIYASESLFRAGISPLRAAGRISKARYEGLRDAIQEVLEASIQQGGTTLRDFVNASGNPGYFRQTLRVYEREGESCRECGAEIRMTRQAQRATYWCPDCQR